MLEAKAHDALVTVKAGGVAPRSAKLPKDEAVSAVTARAYVHPAIAGRTVVCLAPDATALGVDAEMTALGFAAPVIEEDVGVMRHRTLGFPAWPLVHDPKRARFALEVTQELRRAKKQAPTKPGHAKETFDAIGKKLGRTVPHFLPSFWEEAGRTLAEEGAKAMAAQCFEKAREAERAHKLKVDEAARDAVFVEFALLGAVSAKTLSAYAKDLEKSAGAKDAYRRFLTIVVERALGGMPPWSGMAKDLRSLAKAAKLDPDASDDDVVRRLLESPSLKRAPAELWTSYRASIVRTCGGDAALRARLRAVFPEPKTNDDVDKRKAFLADWFTLLDEAKALDGIPDGELAGFVSRLIAYAGSHERVKALLRDVAPRLREPIKVAVGDSWRVRLNLDMAELALSLGVALADPDPDPEGADEDDRASFEVTFTCDPVHVAAEPSYGKKLVALVDSLMGQGREALMRGKAGFGAALHAWLEERIRDLSSSGLYRAERALEDLEKKTSALTFLPYPELHARLAAVTTAPMVAATLRGGLVDELMWPAYEKAFSKLGGKVVISGAFPNAVLRDEVRAIVVGPEGVILEHDFVLSAKKATIEHTFFIDGQLLVFYRDQKDYDDYAYWSGTPKTRFKTSFYHWHWGDFPWTTPLPDGSFTLGGGALRAGDTKLEVCEHTFDGQTVFVASDDDDGESWGLVEYDPQTAKKGRRSKPRFFEQYAAEGWKLRPECTMHAVPLARSPLGVKDGLTGVRVRQRGDVIEAERIDGVKWKGDTAPEALLLLPGDPAPRGLRNALANSVRFQDGAGHGVHLLAPGGDTLAHVNANDSAWAARGWGAVHVPPLPLWHLCTARDEAGSKALRVVDAKASAALLDIARKEVPDEGPASGRALPKTEKAARGLGIKDAALARGVAGVLEHGVAIEHRLRALVQDRAKEAADEVASALGDAGRLARRLADALGRGRAGAFDFELELRPWLQGARGLAARALAYGVSEEKKAEARDILSALAGTVFEKDAKSLRLVEIENDDADYEYGEIAITVAGKSVWALHGGDDWAIERTTDGTFRPIAKGWKIEKQHKIPPAPSADFAKRWAEAAATPVVWDPAAALELASATGLSRAEAILLLLGAPRGNYERDFLGKAIRDAVAIKVGEADQARDVLNELDHDKLTAFFVDALGDDPMVTREPLAWAKRLGAAWRKRFGARVELPEALVSGVQRDLDLGKHAHFFLAGFADPDAAPFLGRATKTIPECAAWDQAGGEELDAANAAAVVSTMLWLFQNEPVGAPLRGGIPAIHAKLTKLLSDPAVIWRYGELYSERDDKKDILDLLSCIPGKAVTFAKDRDSKCEQGRDSGGLLAAIYESRLYAAFRPAKLAKADDAAIRALGAAILGRDPDPVALARRISSPELADLAKRVTDTPVPAGSFEANPLLSAPKVVAAVKKTHGLSDEAAALYLMLLALSEPTDRAVRRFTGWAPKVHASASAELLKKKLVVAGKRARAGREIFLPGGFDKGSSRNLPMEEWKVAFYPPSLPRRLAQEALHALFARAWKRVESGDEPRFERVR